MYLGIGVTDKGRKVKNQVGLAMVLQWSIKCSDCFIRVFQSWHWLTYISDSLLFKDIEWMHEFNLLINGLSYKHALNNFQPANAKSTASQGQRGQNKSPLGSPYVVRRRHKQCQ